MFVGGGSPGVLQEISYCACGCFSSVVAASCVKCGVLLTEPGWMLLGSGFSFSASFGETDGRETGRGGCGLLPYLPAPLFPSPPQPLLRHKEQDEPRVALLEIFSVHLQEEIEKPIWCIPGWARA